MPTLRWDRLPPSVPPLRSSLTCANNASVIQRGIASASTSSASTSSTTGPSKSGPSGTTVTTPASNLHAKRYCEVLLVQVVDGNATAEVYNSFPLNDCPASLWTKLDATAIGKSEGMTAAVLNGPRYWLMDSVEKEGGVAGLPKKDFGGIEMYRQASVNVGSLVEAAKPYGTHDVNRSAVIAFGAGRMVYELTGTDGTVYVMQSWSQQKDPALSEADLPGLASRLTLPTGWTYRARTLDAPLRVVTTTTVAKVLQDDLGNSYSQLPSS